MAKSVTIIGGGPSGLMVADILSSNGYNVTIYERKPSCGRKFLMAGRGGLNITHSENLEPFLEKYEDRSCILSPIINEFTPNQLRKWCLDLDEQTFVGSSGRVFPKSFKASPLLRAWLNRLKNQGVTIELNHDWLGWTDDYITFATKDKKLQIKSDLTVLALGGASWPKLGADGSWVSILEKENIETAPLRPSNCGFQVSWSDIFRNKFSGHALKSTKLSFENKEINGEFMITENGVEGSAIYALSSRLREAINKNGSASLMLDLKPDINNEDMIERLQKPKSRMSMTNYLKKTVNLSDVALGLIMERPDRQKLNDYDAQKLTNIIKNYPLLLNTPFSLERAISSAGGITFDSVDENFMLRNKPNVFVTGEMLDWEAPTGGYLLQACFAMGHHVAKSIMGNEIKE